MEHMGFAWSSVEGLCKVNDSAIFLNFRKFRKIIVCNHYDWEMFRGRKIYTIAIMTYKYLRHHSRNTKRKCS